MESRLYTMILAGFLFISQGLFSQEIKDFTYFNQVTYDHYLKKEWDLLIEAGKEALTQEYDFYYLRARLGIAYFEKGIYSAAIGHLRKALSYHSSEPVMLEYLYYAYVYTSRYQDASLLYYRHKDILDGLSLTWIPKFFDGMTIEGAYKLSNHTTSLGTETGDVLYGKAGLRHNIGGRIYLYHYAGILNHLFTDTYFQENSYTRFRYHFYQFDYYANAHVLLGKGFEIVPTFHFIGVDAYSVSYSDLYYGIGINKHLKRVRIGFHFSYANINDNVIKQFEPKLQYYPLGNNRLYLTLTSIFCKGDIDQEVFSGSLGVRIFPGTWLEGYISSGKSQYISIFDGAIIYNNPDYLLSRIGASVIHYLTPKTSLMLHYIAENKEQFSSGDPYLHHVFAVGFNFKF